MGRTVAPIEDEIEEDELSLGVDGSDPIGVGEGYSREERRHEAFSLMLRGYSSAEIASYLGVTVATVARWTKAKKAEIRERTSNLLGEDYVGLVLSNYAELRSEAWKNYADARRSVDKARFLKFLAELQQRELVALQAFGLLKVEPERFVHEHRHMVAGVVAHASHASLPQKMNGATIEAVAAMLLSDKMGVEPGQLLQMGGRFSDPDRSYLFEDVDADAGDGEQPSHAEGKSPFVELNELGDDSGEDSGDE